MSDQHREFEFLMEQLRQGTPEATRGMIEEYGQHVLRVVRRRLGRELRSQFDSVDFVQDVWASFYAIPPECYTFEHPAQLIGFLIDLATNKVADAYRGRFQAQKSNQNRTRSLDGSAALEALNLAAGGPTPSRAVILREEVEQLLKDQPNEARRLLTLLTTGYTQEEIAQELGVTVRTVRRWMRTIRTAEDS
jgi:RNA polymerase sigma-70 factor (ECF subfamily)